MHDDLALDVKSKIETIFKRCQGIITRNRGRKSWKFDKDEIVIVLNEMTNSIDTSATGNETAPTCNDDEAVTCKRSRSVTPLTEVGSRQKYRRSDKIVNLIKEEASAQKTTPNELLGIVTQRLNYHTNKEAYETGRSLQEGKREKLPLPAAAHLQVYNNLGRAGYQRQLSIFKASGFDIQPTWKEVRAYQMALTPEILPISIDGTCLGIKVLYKSALEITLKQILKTLPSLPPSGTLTFSFKDGCDGSGSHSIYNQQQNQDTNNIIIYMFTPLKVTDSEDKPNTIWKELSPCSPHSSRPLMLFLGKESLQNMRTVMEYIRRGRRNARTSA